MTQTYNDATSSYVAGTATSTLTAFFDSRSEAEAATRRLEEAGVRSSGIRMVPGYEADGVVPAATESRSGFWAALENFFFPYEDREVYSEGLRRGGFLVTVSGITDVMYEKFRIFSMTKAASTLMHGPTLGVPTVGRINMGQRQRQVRAALICLRLLPTVIAGHGTRPFLSWKKTCG